MKLNAKVATLTHEVAKGNASSEKKQLLLWLLELQVFREQDSDVIFKVSSQEKGDYLLDSSCDLNDYYNILRILGIELGTNYKESDCSENTLSYLRKILEEGFSEGIKKDSIEKLN